MQNIRVGVMRGGRGSEYEASVKSGAYILQNIPQSLDAKDLFISKDGEWHIHGKQIQPQETFKYFDVIFNALHSDPGEKQEILQILSSAGLRFSGSQALTHALSSHRLHSQEMLHSFGIRTPRSMVVRDYQSSKKKGWKGGAIGVIVEEALEIAPILVGKPLVNEGSIQTTILRSYGEIYSFIQKAFELHVDTILEEYISGNEVSCIVMNKIGQQLPQALNPISITSIRENVLPHRHKRHTNATHTKTDVPLFSLSAKDTETIKHLSEESHNIFGIENYSQSHFIISPKGIYMLNTETHPPLHEDSTFMYGLHSSKVSTERFIQHIIYNVLSYT